MNTKVMIISCALAVASNGGSLLAQDIDVTNRSTVFPGRFPVTVIRVIDGDTIDVRVPLWPGIVAEYSVRVRGMDAPEIFRPGCEKERDWGFKAKAQAERLYISGEQRVELRDVQYDSFYGRVVADVRRWRSDRWLSFKNEVIERDMAVEWDPGQSDVPWCLLASGEYSTE